MKNIFYYVYGKVTYSLKLIPLIYTVSTTIPIVSNIIIIESATAQITYKDPDGNGLINITYIEQLDSMRYNLTGTCSVTGTETCNGYELMNNLSFKSPSSYRDYKSYISRTMDSSFYSRGEGWTPIGVFSNSGDVNVLFNATFEGNGHTIDSLYINNGIYTNALGFFGYTGTSSIIKNIGIRNASIVGTNYVGGLVAQNMGSISQSYVTGYMSGDNYIGGLVGENIGTISQNYATASVSGDSYVGGLVGKNNGTISQSYATGHVSGGPTSIGSLVGFHDNNGIIHHGYWKKRSSQLGIGTNNGLVRYENGLTLSALQRIETDSILELGPGFIYNPERLPIFNKAARITVDIINFTQTGVGTTNITMASTVTNVIQGTSTTRATITVDGIGFTSNVIGTTNIGNPHTITNIQNGFIIPHTVTFVSISIKTFGDAPFVIAAMSSASLPVLFSASNTLISISDNVVTIRGTGTVRITAYTENDTIDIASATQILTILRNPTIIFGTLANKTFGDAPFIVTATSSADLSVLFSTSNTLVAINNNTITINGAGTSSITAYQTGHEKYLETSVVQSLIIHKASQSITFETLANRTFGDAPFVLTAVSSVDLPVLYSASSALISINTHTVTIEGAGTVNIIASNTGNSNYVEASATQTLFIERMQASLTFTAIPNLTIGDMYTLGATSNSSASITFTSSNDRIASINSNTLTAVDAGTVTITANQEGNTQYNATTSQKIITVVDLLTLPNPLTFIEKGNAAIRILPNPAKDYITIKSAVNIEGYSIYGLDGAFLFSGKELSIDIQSLKKGEYLLIIYGKKRDILSATKIIKQ
ncbi:MAG: hypothetical protein QM536_03925 [Chitinophagaceae bacterium]|nr:hypothetical protein [Chitinophagaceae bacterium]